MALCRHEAEAARTRAEAAAASRLAQRALLGWAQAVQLARDWRAAGEIAAGRLRAARLRSSLLFWKGFMIDRKVGLLLFDGFLLSGALFLLSNIVLLANSDGTAPASY